MRYAKIYDQLWATPDFLCLSTEAKLGYMYLCSCSHCNLIGYFRLPLAYIAADMGIKVDAAARVVKELEAAGFVRYNPDTSRMLIRSYLMWNGSTSPKNIQGMADIFDQLPGDDLDAEFVRIVERYGIGEFFKRSKRACNISVQTNNTVSACDASSNDTVQQSDGYHIDTVSIEYRTQKQKQKQKQENTPLTSPQGDEDDQHEPISIGKKVADEELLETVPAGYREAFRALMADRRARGHKMTPNAVRLTVAKLDKELGTDADRIACINETISNGWTGVFPASYLRSKRTGVARGTSSLPDSVIHTEDAWAGQKGGKISFGGDK